MFMRWVPFVAVFFTTMATMLNGCSSLNYDGLTLLEFRSRVEIDPYGVFENWNPNDTDPCGWSGVICANGNVIELDLKEKSLVGVLAPELGKLSHLRAIILHKNNFTGAIPKEIIGLTMLELMDLRGNKLSGTVPAQIGDMLSLKCLLLCDNNIESETFLWVDKTSNFFDLNFACDVASELECANKKFEYRLNSATHSSHANGERNGDNLASDLIEPYIEQNIHPIRRQLLQESSNLAAASVSSDSPQGPATVPSTGSGSFLAVPNPENSANARPSPPTSPPDSPHPSDPPEGFGVWLYVLIILGVILLLILVVTVIVMIRRRSCGTIGPWKTGLSGQLQKALTTGIPKLNRAELEAACEDFSNIVCTINGCNMFKGTLSSGIEIAVVSTPVKSRTEWSENSKLYFKKKVETLSRINHKNFVNLIGYCEEDQPFMRMMVFEYAPNGTLFDYLHAKHYEPLDWPVRMRVIMGVAYCLQYMHNEVKPPVANHGLHSKSIFMTEDFAAKIADIALFSDPPAKHSKSGDGNKDLTELSLADCESNVYSFGILMLEIISGKLPDSQEGSILDWAAEFFSGKRNISSMVDSSLKSSKENELQSICRVIQDCIHQDPKKRPTMKEVTSTLREALGITPEAATPRGSPLWWAELEILSVEAS